MKTLFVEIFSAFTLVALTAGFKYETLYFTQRVDQFGYSNGDTFSQKYLLNLDYYNSGNGSIFFYCGNEGSIEMFSNNTGFMWEHAQKFNAAIVFAEHRYYGESLPYGNLSYDDNKYRGYLTAEQALADFANLIDYLKYTLPGGKKSPIIAFGGSYGGMLAAWIRMKYPHFITGSIASSAPIFMFGNSSRCQHYSDIITEAFQLQGTSCPALIRRSWNVLKKIGSSANGAKWLGQQFKLCENLCPSNVTALTDAITGVWNYLAMTNYPYPTSFLQPLPANPIMEVCKHLNDTRISDYKLVAALYNAVSVFTNFTGKLECFELADVGGASLGEKGWDYQSCTEMVMPVCSNGVTDMFESSAWDFDSFADECKRKWKVYPLPDKALITYGGENIKASSNIIFTNGKLDPWNAGGVIKSISENLIAIQIDNATHHLDLRFSNPADPEPVIEARNIILKWIEKWISEAKL